LLKSLFMEKQEAMKMVMKLRIEDDRLMENKLVLTINTAYTEISRKFNMIDIADAESLADNIYKKAREIGLENNPEYINEQIEKCHIP
jgi:hypothetical protein